MKPTAPDKILTPFDLIDAPQLAAISVLETALHIARLSLFAQHSELLDDDSDASALEPAARVALRVLRRAYGCSAAIRDYRRTLEPKPLPDSNDDWPF